MSKCGDKHKMANVRVGAHLLIFPLCVLPVGYAYCLSVAWFFCGMQSVVSPFVGLGARHAAHNIAHAAAAGPGPAGSGYVPLMRGPN